MNEQMDGWVDGWMLNSGWKREQCRRPLFFGFFPHYKTFLL